MGRPCMPKGDPERSLSAYKVVRNHVETPINNTMDNNPRPTWERAQSLKIFILERGCQEYEELVALRNEVNYVSLLD